jgi:hypothetical protein
VSEDGFSSHKIYCPRCKRLITLPAITVGAREQCPHCDMDFIISGNMVAREGESIEKGDDIYAIKIDSPDAAAQFAAPSFLGEKAEPEGEEEEILAWAPLGPPPRGLFSAKTFNAPFIAGFRGCAITLLIVSLIMGYMISRMASYLSVGGEQSGSLDYFIPWVLGFIFTFCTVLIGVVLAFVLGAIGIALFRDTFEGYDRFVSWPRDWYANLFRESSYALVAFFWGGLPVFIVVPLLPGAGSWKWPILVMIELILFPVFFLSALESKSPVMLYSRAVWKSMYCSRQAWQSFYLLTLPMGAAFVVFAKLPLFQAVEIKTFIIFLFLPFFFLVYFRLLGRLARYCSGRLDEGEQYSGERGDYLPEQEDDSLGAD